MPPTCLASQKLQSARITCKLVRSLAKTSPLKALQKLIDDNELYIGACSDFFLILIFFFFFGGRVFFTGGAMITTVIL